MAVNLTDFSRAPIQDSPLSTLFEDALKGYKMGREPANMAASEKKNALANQLSQLEVEHKPKEYELNDQQKKLANALQDLALKHKPKEYSLADSLKQSQIDKNNRPGGSTAAAKPSGELANFIVAHPDATQDQIRAVADELYKLHTKHTETISNRSADMVSGAAYDKQPVNEKKRAVGLTTAMGIDPIEGVRLLRSGKSLDDIAKDKGVKLADLTPMYPMGEENIKQLQKRAGYVSEIKNLEQKLVEPLAKYQNKIGGFSLEQTADALEGKDPDEQGKVLAARALQPELVALRLKVAGGNIGIEAIKELQSKSLGNLKIIEGLVDTKAYTAMQKYMTKWLEEAANQYSNTMEDYGRLKTPQQKSAEREAASASRVFNLGTGGFE